MVYACKIERRDIIYYIETGHGFLSGEPMKQNVVDHVIVPEKGNAFPKIHRCFGSVIL